ncbi:hypothetical protein [Jannaschia marina]|uniref:hypothetical protein n=1 Tax=Jannaschia marina TaxID=2741674 RepID=UPI0015CDCFF0|nr:hypothetical protein [Jannaschia marina]
MRLELDYIREFLRDTKGAISVDYVVLAGAVTAVGLATTDVIEWGMRALASTVDSELKGEAPGSENGLSYNNGFDNTAAGWTGAGVTEINGIGNVLGPIENTGGQAGVNRDFTIADDVDRATFTFDLLSMDNFDGDTGTVYVDDQAVGSVTVSNGTPVFTAADNLEERGIIIRYTEIDTGVQLGGGTDVDARSNIAITVRNDDPDNPLGNVNIGFGSNATAGADNEFFAIDNFRATGLAGEG